LVLAALAGLLHVYIFVLESWRWEAPATRRTFGTSAPVAAITKPLAFNQGFYNLFLAVGALAGVAITPANHRVGLTLVVFAASSMLAAALVLFGSDRSKLRAAAVQGTPALLALLALLLWAL
jgi:putative membrane protein